MAKTDGFPWGVFSANTLRPMVSDIFRGSGMHVPRLDKEDSIALLQKIEKHGLDTALKDITTTGKKNASASAPPGANASASGSAKRKRKEPEQVDAAPPVASASGRMSTRAKRTHEEPELDDADNGAASEQRVSTRAKRRHEEPVTDTDIAATGGRTSTRAKRKRDEPDADNGAAAPRKRAPGRSRKAEPETETVSSPVSPRRGRNSDPGEGLLTRRQAAQARGESIPTRSWKSPSRTRKTSTAGAANGAGDSVSAGAKPKSKGVFDGVELVKRPRSYVGKGKEREIETGDDQDAAGSDVDAEGEVVDDGMEQETGTSSLENSNKENEATITDLANEETDADVDAEGEDVFIIPDEIGSPVPQSASEPADEAQLNHLVAIGSPPPEGTVGEDCLLPDGSSVPHSARKATDEEAQLDHLVTIDDGSPPPEETMSEDLPLPEYIGSPAPQITVEPTDDQIEEARLNHDVSMDIGSPAPEIRIEPIADDGEEIEFEENGFTDEGGLLHVRPQIDTARAGTPLNPEYRIEVLSPGSAQHDSDDEMWVTSGMNGNSEGLRAAGGGLDALD
ncbi:hypothetical protein C8R47DRAFT_1090459 [Mycena vitilis]|nr:hypothetical protein C8R47DRAFT_1090459 [Mycena vitilis]